ncbi:response regulator receiver protein [Hyphomicrobium denitrificans 1NES1]|uniref:Response regulator receiver protein n=1 Tax=Hyphomicrobium denitrificans 1NES1 TaxID=670307 RepID=N0B6C1_9HYPH|nr:response regulator [Hyphomicrobium denitrificans]AGK58533.1 response regulator receiver protein [Hyphomicrobium denitrificans 1NES1]
MADAALAKKRGGSPKARILLVEDEILIRLAMADDLRRAGFTVVEASNADEALSVLNTTPDIALVVTDIRMPGRIDGVELANWIRRHAPRIKVAIASANIESGMDRAFDAVFSKPVLTADLIARVRKLLPRTEQSG